MHRKKFYTVVACVCVCLLFQILYFLSIHIETPIVLLRSYEKDFHYPLDVDLKLLVAEFLEHRVLSVEPINIYSHEFLVNSDLCSVLPQVDLIIAVKTALEHFGRRNAIRKTYGKATRVKGKEVRVLFFVGVLTTQTLDVPRLQSHLGREMEVYKDIIQGSFLDHYYFNTDKTMMTFRWLYENCPNAKFYFFADDDMYVSPANLLRYLDSWEARVNETDQQDRRLLAGYVFPKFKPQRSRKSKWYIPLEDYPWDAGPPFTAAGAFVMTSETARTIYAASLFVRHLIYDDVYIGIVAHKIGLQLTHCPQIHFYGKKYTRSGYRDVIASHGYNKPKKLINVWNVDNKLA